jgi:hypothetical protein
MQARLEGGWLGADERDSLATRRSRRPAERHSCGVVRGGLVASPSMRRLAILAALALGLAVVGPLSVAGADVAPWTGTVVHASDVGSSWPLRAASVQLACAFTPTGRLGYNAVSVVVSHHRYALDPPARWIGVQPIVPILRPGTSPTSGGVVALRLLAQRLCTRRSPNLACDISPEPPGGCDPLAAYPQAQTSLCHTTCPYISDTPGREVDPALGHVVVRVTIDPPDVSVRGVVSSCDSNGASISVPFVARSGDAIDLPLVVVQPCFVTATALWTQPFAAGARHVVTLAIVAA